MHAVSGRGLVISAVTVGLSLFLTACGGADSTTSAGGGITKAEFVKQGNAICEKGSEEIEAAAAIKFPKGNKQPGKGEQTEFASQTVIPSIQHQIDELEALGFPEGEEEAVETILTEAQNALTEARKDPSVLLDNGPGPFASADKFADSYGLAACGVG
jgi:hypothetical protein